jgi:hypothetical protein
MTPIVSLETIGFATEGTFGTFVAPSQFVPGHATLATNTKVVRPAQSRGTRSQVVDALVGVETGVTITGELIPEVFSRLAAAAFGSGSDAVSGSAGTGFTHILTPKNALPSLSVEVDHDISSQVLARQVVGCVVDQLTLKATNQQLGTLEAQLIGQREITPATPGLPSNPTPAISTLQPMDFSLLASVYKGVATTQLMDVTLSIMNHVQRVFSSNGKLYLARLVPTLREVQLQTTLDFLDTTFYNDWIAANKTSAGGLVLTFTGSQIPSASGFFTVEFTVPGIRPQGQYNLQDASDVINQQLGWSVTLQGANEVSSRWLNSESGALA